MNQAPISSDTRFLLAGLAVLFPLTACDGTEKQVPAGSEVGVRVFEHRIAAFNGELIGSNRGEFIGELAYRSHAGTITPLIKKNVVGIYAMPFGFIAITGLAHLRTNEGEILLVSRSGAERLRVERLSSLPAAPMETRQRADGAVELRLFTGNFGADGNPSHVCWRLETDKRLHASKCPSDWPQGMGWPRPDRPESQSP